MEKTVAFPPLRKLGSGHFEAKQNMI